MAFSINSVNLRQIWKLGGLPAIDKGDIVVVAIRGAVPAVENDLAWKSAVVLDGSLPYDHQNNRCTLLQWDTEKNLIAAYKGSTVPTQKYVDAATARGGRGANLCMPGLYDFKQGQHAIGKKTEHAAWREVSPKLILRTADDGTYEFESDPLTVDNPWDNLHADWSESDAFSSAGCWVVDGTPSRGQWVTFKERGYNAPNANLRGLLLLASFLKAMLVEPLPFVMLGSRGNRAKRVQDKLIREGLLSGDADGVFGVNSARALAQFQQRNPKIVCDAICTADDARELAIGDWLSSFADVAKSKAVGE